MKHKYRAFTLIEMLMVMGIIIILMAVGIASGRFAIRRANKIEHKDGADQIYQAAQSYYSDFKEYPGKDGASNVETILGTQLDSYIDDFEGGSEASYTYEVDDTGQEVIVCVTYGGISDENQLGMYCTGNAIGSDVIEGAPTTSDIEYATSDYESARLLFDDQCSAWTGTDGWGSEDCTVPTSVVDDGGGRDGPPVSPI